ncbi:hypothetical protein ACLOJK_002563 [Asimina triloba]
MPSCSRCCPSTSPIGDHPTVNRTHPTALPRRSDHSPVITVPDLQSGHLRNSAIAASHVACLFVFHSIRRKAHRFYSRVHTALSLLAKTIISVAARKQSSHHKWGKPISSIVFFSTDEPRLITPPLAADENPSQRLLSSSIATLIDIAIRLCHGQPSALKRLIYGHLRSGLSNCVDQSAAKSAQQSSAEIFHGYPRSPAGTSLIAFHRGK